MGRSFGQDDRAEFTGRFVLEGTFVLDCEYCEPGYKDNQLTLSVVPDPSIAVRLPHWKAHETKIEVDISGAAKFIETISTPGERKKLLSGKATEADDIKGRLALVVSNSKLASTATAQTTRLGSSLSPVRRNAIAPLPRAISAADRVAPLASPPALQ
jgi:hypothetical protein